MVLKLLAVLEHFIATGTCSGSVLRVIDISLRSPHLLLVLRLLLLLLLGLLPLQFLLFLHELCRRVLVQIEVETGPFCEVFVCLGNRMTVILDLFDLVQVFFESFAGVGRVVPSLGLLNDRCYRLILDHSPNVDRVVHSTEYTALIRILHAHILQ